MFLSHIWSGGIQIKVIITRRKLANVSGIFATEKPCSACRYWHVCLLLQQALLSFILFNQEEGLPVTNNRSTSLTSDAPHIWAQVSAGPARTGLTLPPAVGCPGFPGILAASHWSGEQMASLLLPVPGTGRNNPATKPHCTNPSSPPKHLGPHPGTAAAAPRVSPGGSSQSTEAAWGKLWILQSSSIHLKWIWTKALPFISYK